MRAAVVRKLAAVAVVAALGFAACGVAAGADRVYRAEFERAVQVFPGVKVRVLGVNVGEVVEIEIGPEDVEIVFRVDDELQLPADVQAAVVPASLLGERYIQLFPAYPGGPTLPDGATIPLSRTAVPAEPDELLRSIQDYLGALDTETVTEFVENAARALAGNGQELNRLVEHAAGVVSTLSSERDDLATFIVELDKLTLALASRQESVGRLIETYNAVAGTLNENRAALEGTITGLNEAAIQLAALLVAHRGHLPEDIEALTRTGRTIGRNAEALARTGHWAERLFRAASRAVDYDRDWLRLGNQGHELGAMILLRLQQRLAELCADAGAVECASMEYWAYAVPGLFCFQAHCPAPQGSPAEEMADAVSAVPELDQTLAQRAAERECEAARYPKWCIKRALEDPDRIRELIEDLLDGTIGDPSRWGGLL